MALLLLLLLLLLFLLLPLYLLLLHPLLLLLAGSPSPPQRRRLQIVLRVARQLFHLGQEVDYSKGSGVLECCGGSGVHCTVEDGCMVEQGRV